MEINEYTVLQIVKNKRTTLKNKIKQTKTGRVILVEKLKLQSD